MSATVAGGLLMNCWPARAGERRAALAIDVGVPVLALIAALGLLLVPTAGAESTRTLVAVGLVIAAAGWLIGFVWMLGSHGRSVGRLFMRLRTVDSQTASAVSVASLLRSLSTASWPGGTTTFNLKRGRDPHAPAFLPLPADHLHPDVPAEEAPPTAESRTIAEPGSGQRADMPQRRGRRADTAGDGVTLVFDSGQRVDLTQSLLVGRNPQPTTLATAGASDDDEDTPVFAWPDLSRTLSKTHALLEWDGRHLWVTDLGSTNGTTLVGEDAGVTALVPQERTRVPGGSRVVSGDREMSFEIRKLVTS